ncbi:MAG: hypothetical protein M0P61_06400 [Ignavibacteriaceae bacterium]|jgi:hypothetical protein|nr:hypothetical protein [Ignavibacteriaceae bacterium]
MELKFKTKITRREKQKEVEISFAFSEKNNETKIEDIHVYEEGKEIKNYSIPAVINAIHNYLGS